MIRQTSIVVFLYRNAIIIVLVAQRFFSRPAALRHFLDDALKCSYAHSSLTMPGQGVVSRKGIATPARVWLDPGVDLGVPLEIMLSDKAFLANQALELAISKMGLDMGFDIFLSPKPLVAVWIFADPLSV